MARIRFGRIYFELLDSGTQIQGSSDIRSIIQNKITHFYSRRISIHIIRNLFNCSIWASFLHAEFWNYRG